VVRGPVERRRRVGRSLLCAAFFLEVGLGGGALAPEAGAVVTVGAADEARAAPPHFPYWEHVGRRGGLSAVYLGERWVVTAQHVGAGPLELRGRTYEAEPGSAVHFETGGSRADLLLYRLREDPGLAPVPISRATLATQTSVWMVGYGACRGVPLRWAGRAGFRWGESGALRRWGTNRIEGRMLTRRGATLTEVFFTEFDPPEDRTPAESQAAAGDSGGGVFARNPDGDWELAGILVMVLRTPGQPGSVALYGDRTLAVDLSFYRDQFDVLRTRGAAL
jgi:hypothetical protein